MRCDERPVVRVCWVLWFVLMVSFCQSEKKNLLRLHLCKSMVFISCFVLLKLIFNFTAILLTFLGHFFTAWKLWFRKCGSTKIFKIEIEEVLLQIFFFFFFSFKGKAFYFELILFSTFFLHQWFEQNKHQNYINSTQNILDTLSDIYHFFSHHFFK